MVEKSLLYQIRKFREQLGLKQEEIADELGVSRATYANFEEGRVKIFCGTLEKMAKFAGVPVSVILYGIDLSPEYLLLESQKEKDKRKVIEQYEARIRELEEDKKNLYLMLDDARETHAMDRKTINYLIRDTGDE